MTDLIDTWANIAGGIADLSEDDDYDYEAEADGEADDLDDLEFADEYDDDEESLADDDDDDDAEFLFRRRSRGGRRVPSYWSRRRRRLLRQARPNYRYASRGQRTKAGYVNTPRGRARVAIRGGAPTYRTYQKTTDKLQKDTAEVAKGILALGKEHKRDMARIAAIQARTDKKIERTTLAIVLSAAGPLVARIAKQHDLVGPAPDKN